MADLSPTNGMSEVVILGRILSSGQKELTPDLARYFLALGFDDDDKARMHQLALKNQESTLSSEEKDQLLGYAKAGCLLGIVQAKARKFLKRSETNKAS